MPGPSIAYDQIPEELRALRNWVAWRSEKRAGRNGAVRETKVPYHARTAKRARSNDPATWSTFEEAQAALKRGDYTGLGFCLTPPYVGVDLDGCRQNGSNEPWAAEIIRELDSYSELSPSGHGVHVIVRGQLPDGPRQKDLDGDHHGVGLYDAARGRYLTMTGAAINGNFVQERTAELRRIHARLFPPKKKPAPRPQSVGGDDDDQLIERARNANDGGKFARLWDGQWEGDYPSQSEADSALCMKLAFWTNRDAGRIDALFRRSGLMRDKWEKRKDYREATIARAIERTTETWKPKVSTPERSVAMAARAIEPSVEMLNATTMFHERIRFKSFSRRGSMILATTETGQQIIFPTMQDVTSFARARAAVAEGADVLLPQPPRNQVAAMWDPVAEMIIRLSARDAIRVEHALKAEVKDLLILMWRYAKQPGARNSKEFMDFMIEISQSVRDPARATPPSVFTAEEYCWVHLPSLRQWLSLPALTNRQYPYADIRQGLLLLGFEYQKDVTRGADGDSESASLWRGPLDVLLD
jgi:hypothetical protein